MVSIEIRSTTEKISVLPGMPHVHLVGWLHEDKIEPYLKKGTYEYNKDVTKLIDQTITCELPQDIEKRKAVKDLQSHSHSKSCRKKGATCRFDFPKLPSNETIISLPVDKDSEDGQIKLKESNETKDKMKAYIQSEDFDENKDLTQILKDLDISIEKYRKALAISDRGSQVILKRAPNECYINNYNKDFLHSWQANMDIQFCTDVYAVVTYICDYYSKDETGMTDFLKEALKEAKSLENREMLSLLRKTYMSKRQIGLSEAVYRLIPSMHLQGSNIACTFVHSGYPENQSKFLRKVNTDPEREGPAIEESDTSDDDLVEDDEAKAVKEDGRTFKVHGREGLYMETTSVHDKYVARPKAVERLTLAQFATHYTKCQKKPKKLILKNGISEETGDYHDYLEGM